jgi:alpha-tubulin suppressor-like RCC1 family protein
LLFAFGQNSYGELGISDTQERLVPTHVPFFDKHQISAIAAGNEHIAVKTRQGDIYTVGFNGSGQLGHGSQKSFSVPQKIQKYFKTDGGVVT